tara:strand:+ start:153 stop:569 length:417 start_codon:yes stop_codon:yes gene_type:complete
MDFSSILVPVSGSSSDKQVVELACKLLNSPGSHLFIVYIIQINRSLPIDATLTPEIVRGDNILKSLEILAEKYKHQVTAELVQAREAGYAIVQEANHKKVDGIAMTIPNSTKFGRFELEKTVTYVLKNAGCKIVLWND